MSKTKSRSRTPKSRDAGRETITDLEGVLEQIENASGKRSKVRIKSILESVGARSFGPLLVLAGIITISPIGDVPGVPTLIAIVVLIVAVQQLVGRDHFWFPQWFLKREISGGKVQRTVRFVRKPARFVDKLLRPRWQKLTRGTAVKGIALACIVVGAITPLMEVIPFTATGAGMALLAFGLALIAHDGVIASVAFVMTAVTGWFVFGRLL